MRYSILIFALAVAMGCKKSTSPATGAASATFQFTANGTVYQINGNLATTSLGAKFFRQPGGGCSGDTIYWLTATDAAGDGFDFATTPAASLSVAPYNINYDPNAQCNVTATIRIKALSSNWYEPLMQGDYTTIVVTNIHNGLADGTFTGHLTLEGNTAQVLSITNGQFQNISVVN